MCYTKNCAEHLFNYNVEDGNIYDHISVGDWANQENVTGQANERFKDF